MNQLGSLGDMWSILKRRLPVILAITGLGCALSVYFALQQPRIYETSALVQLEDAQIIDARTGRTDAAHKLQLIEQRMMARDNLVEIIEDYALYHDTDMSLALKVAQLRESARITAITDASQPWAPNANPTGLIITVTLADPQQAADVANELLARIVEQGTSRQVQSARETLAFFRAQEEGLSGEIAVLEEQIADFKQVNADSLPSAVTALRSQLATLSETDLEIERQIIELQSSTRRAREGVTEAQVDLLNQQRAAVRERMTAIEAAIDKAPQVEQELSVLDRRLTQLKDQYSVVTRRRAEAETSNTLLANEQTERFEVLETALVPEFPVSRSRKKTALMGGIASAVLAIGGAMLLEMLNPAIRTAAQLERSLGLQTVISIPRVTTRRERRLRQLVGVGAIAGMIASLPLIYNTLRDKAGGFGLFRKGDGQIARP